jgi:signal transduction histidine kinase
LTIQFPAWLRINIAGRMLGYMLVASILPLALLGVTAFETSKRLVTEQAEAENARLAGSFVSYLQLYYSQVEDMAANISGNEAIGAALRRSTENANNTYDSLEARANMGRMLNNYVRVVGMVSIDVFSTSGAHFHVGETLKSEKVDPQQIAAILKEAKASDTSILWRGIDKNINGGGVQVNAISVVRTIEHFSPLTGRSDTVGLLVIALSNDIMLAYLRGAPLAPGTQLMQLDRNGRVMLHSDPSQFGQELNPALLQMIDARSPPERISLDGEGALMRVGALDQQKRRVVVIAPEKPILQKVDELAKATLVIIALCLLVIVLMTWNFARAIVTPIRAVSTGFNRLSTSPDVQPNALPSPHQQDEIGQLVLGYNNHLVTLHTQRATLAQLQESEALLKDAKDRADALNAKLELRVAEISKLTEGLEVRVQERTEALKASNELLAANIAQLSNTREQLVKSEKLAGLGALVAGVSHELNTPIGNALIAATTVHQRTVEFVAAFNTGKMTRKALEEYFQSALEGNALTEQSLRRAADLISSFKQVAVDQSSERRRSFDLAQTAKEIASTFLYSLRTEHQRLDLEIADGIEMEGYPGPLGQVLINLISNAQVHAFENTSSGAMRLSATVSPSGWVRIEFRDNGCGIAESHLKRIFDPFFTTKLGQGGSGLGLSVANNIVEGLLGGSIRVESQLGNGTLFVIDLPLVAPG